MVHKLCDFRLVLCRIFLGSGFSEAEPKTGIIVCVVAGVGGDFWMKGGEECRVGQGKELSKDVFSSWNLDSA